MKIHCKFDELINPKDLKTHPKNRNFHPKEQIERLSKILEYQGFRYAIKVSKLSGFITSGHGRALAAITMGLEKIPVVYQDYDDETMEYADVQADNAIASWADLDLSLINEDIGDLGPDFDIDLLGIKSFEIDVGDKAHRKMVDVFGAPPFSVLNAREGYWQDRKREWINLGIKSEIGRGGGIDSELQKPRTIGAIPSNQKTLLGKKY